MAASAEEIIEDQGIHMLDLFLYLGGDFHEVQAMVSNLYWKLDIEDKEKIIEMRDMIARMEQNRGELVFAGNFEEIIKERLKKENLIDDYEGAG